MYNRFLTAFTKWFSGPACFWQTSLIVGGIAIVELIYPSIDPHGFWLLWALTLFSAWTQPALAYGNATSAQQLDKTLEHLEIMMAKVEVLTERAETLEEQNAELLARVVK